jgi:hypothetical protein
MQYSVQEIITAPKDRCWVNKVKNVSEQHHIRPVEYGGPEDGLTVPLCPSCHTFIHREAAEQFNMITANKFVNRENFPKEDEYNRAWFLADYVLKSKLTFVASGEKKAEGARNMMSVSFERDELAMAHDVKKMLGFRAMDRMVKYLILDKWKELKKAGK